MFRSRRSKANNNKGNKVAQSSNNASGNGKAASPQKNIVNNSNHNNNNTMSTAGPESSSSLFSNSNGSINSNKNNNSNTPNRRTSKNSSKTSKRDSSKRQSSSSIPEPVKQQIIQTLPEKDAAQLTNLLTQYPTAAQKTYTARPGATPEGLLSLALLHRCPLPMIQTIYQAHPAAITQGNHHGMSPLHQAATVETSLDVMLFLVTALKNDSDVASVGQLLAPGGWSVLHIACRCGTLPTDTFQYLLGQTRTTLAAPTADKGSTPLHLAIFGLHHHAAQRQLLQTLLQAYPYAANTPNASGYTPVQLAQHQATKGNLPRDVVGLLLDVQGLVRRKYGTRHQVEQAILRCQAKLDQVTTTGGGNNTDAADGGSFNSSISSNGSGGSNGKNSNNNSSEQRKGGATDQKVALRQGMLAHIEMQMLLPMRKKFQSEDELRQLIEEKTRQRAGLQNMGPSHLAQTMALNEELIALEAKLRREMDALVPQEIQTTSEALFERLQVQTHVLPINNVSLQWLKKCTDNFSDDNKIGKGGFGSVYRAYDGAKSAQYAIKKTEKVNDPSLLREVEVLAHVFHPNVVNLLGFYVPPDGKAPEYLVYEFAAGGTLADRVSSKENRKSLTWQIRLSSALGIASGLNYLHHGTENKILHHDLKPENVVFTETLDRAILIDCGISKILKNGMVASFKQTMAGTPFYLPDDYTENTPYDEKCEVFSFGMVLKVMISGRMPKSLNDRHRELEADPLAGDWPEGILQKFMDLTQLCVQKEAAGRPTVAEMYQKLTELEQESDQQMEFTAQEEEAIHDTLTKSRARSRQSRKLESFAKCFCSRTKKKGLYCPGQKHFQCTECFNKYVLDCLGEDVYCREACSCQDPYTLDELHHHLKRSVLLAHIQAIMRDHELKAYKKANSRLTNEIGRGFDRVMDGITNLARDELQCPILAVLIPARSDCRNRSVMKRVMRSWKTSTSKTFFLYFLCAHDKSIVPAPIRLDATRDWVKSAAPFFRAVLCGLQVAVMAAGIPLSIPMMDRERKQDSITENLVVLDQMLVDVAGNDRSMDRDMQQVLFAMQNGAAGQRISSESYRLVAELANQPGNTGWRDRMVLAERQGELAWVSRENEARWKHG